mmetsp:Transcript_32919/g.79643  ORF Transcript_32919/g.79643 Transcript_32919/m.79643 type:complete len:223 (+) Transcript_32919:252-920(+)|eukprot:CAMPEP_0181126012 /NCGR_PEP_ID=MMETSP1071-20121207/27376_1 /TAXON_ID=35127 /ORGANISM="Thalassiosira sp., Strain NH16" /LENGTH=222 /DNA_ID=CAMNT_0023211533 /DNA_START=173 /DNA_END=841 /DNA_ORIENTATION=-
MKITCLTLVIASVTSASASPFSFAGVAKNYDCFAKAQAVDTCAEKIGNADIIETCLEKAKREETCESICRAVSDCNEEFAVGCEVEVISYANCELAAGQTGDVCSCPAPDNPCAAEEKAVETCTEKNGEAEDMGNCFGGCLNGMWPIELTCDAYCTAFSDCSKECAVGCEAKVMSAINCDPSNVIGGERCSCSALSATGLPSVGSFVMELSDTLKEKKNLRA